MEIILVLLATHWQFIGTVFLGALVKILLSESLSWRGAATSAAIAVFAATFFTTPTVSILSKMFGTDLSDNTLMIAALYTIAGEGIVRAIAKASQDETALTGFIFAAIKRFFNIGGPK